MYAAPRQFRTLFNNDNPRPPDLYYQAFPNDRRFTKCLVYTVYMIELVQTIIMARDAFTIFGYGFGDLAALTGVHLEWFAICILSGIGTLL
jgi:hypothetical protein